jgi:hypothetical protein
MAYPFMPMTTKTVRKVSGAVKDSNLSESTTKIYGKFESKKIKEVSETNPLSLKKIRSRRCTHNHYKFHPSII